MDYFVIEIDLTIKDLKIEVGGAYRLVNTTINEKAYLPNDEFLKAVEKEFSKSQDDSDIEPDNIGNRYVKEIVDSLVITRKANFMPRIPADKYTDNWEDATVVEYKTYVERKEG
jgi:hypothetical protein